MASSFTRREILGNAVAAGVGTLIANEASGQMPGECAASRKPPHEIWGSSLMKQPFDEKPFRAINPPAWLEEITALNYCFSVIDDTARDRAAKAGSQMSEMAFVNTEHVYYESAILKNRMPGLSAHYVERQIAGYKKRSVRILAAPPPTLQAEIYINHPEWRRISTNTTTIPQADLKAAPYGGPLCLLGPWGDTFIELLAEILTKFPDVAAFSFDGLHHAGFCYCAFCRENCRKDMGIEIPSVDMNNPQFRHFLLSQDRRLERLIERMQARLKGIKPDAALVTWSTNAGRFGHFLDIPRNMSARTNLLFDAPDQEFWMDETNRGSTIVPAFANAYVWAVTNHRIAFSTPYILSHGNPYGVDSFPPHEMMQRTMLVLTHGARPSGALAQPARLLDATYTCLSEVKRRSPWLTHKEPERWAAIVMSDMTRNFYGRESGQVEDRYLANVFGSFRAALEEHLAVTIISDWNLNPADLSRYKVLVLPNTACLSDSQCEAIRQFVRNGGGLVASLDTSLFDEIGNPKKDFALADVFGVRYLGAPSSEGGRKEELDVNFAKGLTTDYWNRRKNIFDLTTEPHPIMDHPKLKSYLGQEAVTFKGEANAIDILSHNAVSIAKIRVRAGNARPTPAVIANSYGKGRVVYLAAGLDSAYYLYPYPYQRLILAQAIRWAALDPCGIEVTAPLCVQATYFRQKRNGERLIVHLYNDLNSSANHALPNEDVPLREESVPIHDIIVHFKGYDLGKITSQPDGKELKPQRTAGGLAVAVPKLEVHCMVVAELRRN